MIELIIAKKLNDLGLKNFPYEAPKDTPLPYVVWHSNGLKKHKDFSSTKHRTADIQFNVFARTYKESKTIQYQLIEHFEELDEVNTLNEKHYSLISSLNNAIDLFNTELKQTVVDISIEYLIS
uniref:hypothetical protein n=1 Tax=Shewanella sp. TaxID=50422 RepID=UPI004047F952